MGRGSSRRTGRRLTAVRLAILAVGKMKDGPERELQSRYLDRARAAGRSLGFSALDLFEVPEGRSNRAADRKAEEAKFILERMEDGILIALDEKGETPTSEKFSAMLRDYLERGEKSLIFVIGGADGLPDDILTKATKKIAFGAMTLPHQLARILLTEQIYRAMTLMSGHPYHRV